MAIPVVGGCLKCVAILESICLITHRPQITGALIRNVAPRGIFVVVGTLKGILKKCTQTKSRRTHQGFASSEILEKHDVNEHLMNLLLKTPVP